MIYTDLFAPPDVDAAHDEWRASCGPCALAAIAAVPLSFVRPHLADFEQRRGTYMNFRHMLAACNSMKLNIEPHPKQQVIAKLFLIQFGGPWMKPGVNPKWALTQTHWVAKFCDAVYDCNNEHGWISKEDWERETLGMLMELVPRCDKTWSLRDAIAVDLSSIPGKHPALC